MSQTSSEPRKMRLDYDIFWRVGKDYLSNPVEILALASTCRSLHALLEKEVYIADVLDVKNRLKWGTENRCEHPSYHSDEHDIGVDDADHDHDNDAATPGSQGPSSIRGLATEEDADTEMTNTGNGTAAEPGTGTPRSTSPNNAARPASRLPERFPSESCAEWISELRNNHPQGGLHALATGRTKQGRVPISSVRKALAAAEKFWPDYVKLRGTFGDAPIHIAARHGQREIVQLLLLPREDGGGGCAPRAASEYSCWDPRPLSEIVNHLAALGGSKTRGNIKGRAAAISPPLSSPPPASEVLMTAPHQARKPKIHLNASRGGGYFGLSIEHQPFVTDALGCAILGGHVDVAELLLQHPGYDRESIRSCLENDDKGYHKWEDDKGYHIASPLHLAALAGMPSVVEALIERGVDPNVGEPLFHNCSALHMASTRDGTRGAMRVLLDHGADLAQLDEEGRTAVQWAEAFGVEGLPAWLMSLDVPRIDGQSLSIR